MHSCLCAVGVCSGLGIDLLLVLLSLTAEITKTHLSELHHSTPPPPHGLNSMTKTCSHNVISLSVVGIGYLKLQMFPDLCLMFSS